MTPPERSISPSSGLKEARDRFASLWQSGKPQRIEDVLAGRLDVDRRALLHELLVLEFYFQSQGGEQPDPASYEQRFAGDADIVAAAFAAWRSGGRGWETDEADSEETVLQSRYQPGGSDYVPPESGDPVDPADQETIDHSLGSTGGASPPAAAGRTSRLPQIEGYEMLSRIGRGGMGLVLKARHVALNRLVAIKMPRGQLVDEEDHERFLREARAAARLRHPNICPIYDVAEQSSQPYLAMAFIEGRTLKGWASQQQRGARQCAETVAALAHAVEYAHQRGVVHRDIKPSNVMVDDETGNPVLMDFGLAKNVGEDDVQLTQSGQVMGTPAYMAPEQAAGKTDEIGPLSDVYALGAVLYELLTGRPPFIGSSGEVIHRVQSEEPVSPRKLAPSLHRDLETVCLKAMAKAPSARYASAAALADDLERFCGGEAILARREGPLPKLVRAGRRHARALAAFGLLAAVAVAVVVYYARGASDARRLSALSAALNDDLGGPVHRADELQALDALVAEIRVLDAAAGEKSAGLVNHALADSIRRELLGKPRLVEADLSQIEGALARLEARAAALVPELQEEFRRRLHQWQRVAHIAVPFAQAAELFRGEVYVEGNELRHRFDPPPRGTPLLLTQASAAGSVRLRVKFAQSWTAAESLGLQLHADDTRGYAMRLRALPPPDAKDGPTAAVAFGDLPPDGMCQMEIVRDGVTLRRLRVPLDSLVDADDGGLQCAATREANRLEFQAGANSLAFDDVFAVSGKRSGSFGVHLPAGVGLVSLTGEEQAQPESPSPLEQGDALFASGHWDAALALYDQQQRATAAAEVRELARYKQGLCHARAGRPDKAAEIFEALYGGGGEQVRVPSACQLWLLLLREDRFEEAEVIFESLSSQYQFEQLASLVPDAERQAIIDRLYSLSGGFNLFQFRQAHLRPLERAVDVERFLAGEAEIHDMRYWQLMRGYHMAEQTDRALGVMQRLVEETHGGISSVAFVEEYSWLLRQKGRTREALTLVNRNLQQPPDTPDRLRLHVERARIHAAMDMWDEAERDINAFLQSPVVHTTYRDFSAAHMIQGFLLRRQGEDQQALEAWRGGTYDRWRPSDGRGQPAALKLTGMEFENALVMASLSRQLTAAELATLLDVSLLGEGFAGLLAKRQAHMVAPAVAAMATQPSSLARLETLALQQSGLRQYVRIPLVLLFLQVTRQCAPGQAWSPEEERLVEQLVEDAVEAFAEGTINQLHVVQLFATWKGTTGVLGWGGASAQLPGQVRGPAAYVFGHRYIQREELPQARRFFESAVADAESNPVLKRLASAALEKLAP